MLDVLLYGVCLLTEEIVHSKQIEKAEYGLMYVGVNVENKCVSRVLDTGVLIPLFCFKGENGY